MEPKSEIGDRRRDELKRLFSKGLTHMLDYVRIDIRDEWPTEMDRDSYNKGDVLYNGQYGQVVAARARPPVVGFTHTEPRACVVKTSDIGARFDACLRDGGDFDAISRITKLARRIVMETYILNRARHSNILHSHVTVMDEKNFTMHIVLPRLYPLDLLIEKYRSEKDGEPMPIRIVMVIIRQLCRALQYLHAANIVHSDVQPDNIYMTRGGTLKLAHFSQSRMLTSERAQKECLTPTGKEEFMCFEKQFNLRSAPSLEECMPYSASADIWSVGVLVLHMVNYFPNEKWHRLPRNFALQMGEQKMPFKWMISEMMQLRVRLAQSGDEHLKNFLSDKLLNVDPEARATAEEVLQSSLLKKWCSPELEKDKEYLVRMFIHDLDWPNRFRLETDGYNYDACEAKDIPAEFYWDSTWKELEKRQFWYRLQVVDNGKKRGGSQFERHFSHSDLSLFEALMCGVEANELELFDIIPIDQHIRNMCFALMTKEKASRWTETPTAVQEVDFLLPASLHTENRSAKVQVGFASDR